MELYPIRKRIRLPRPVYQQGHTFFITFRTYRRYPWFRLKPELADLGVGVLRQTGAVRGTKLYAWCIMPDHIHLLIQDEDIVDFVRLFKGRMTRKAFVLERGRRLWQRSFYDHALRKEESLINIASYIWENPVRSSLAKTPQMYLWSGSDIWHNWREFCGRG
jgi:putative transposase